MSKYKIKQISHTTMHAYIHERKPTNNNRSIETVFYPLHVYYRGPEKFNHGNQYYVFSMCNIYKNML